MLRATRRRIGAPAWLALGLVLGLPALAEAQLFPNRTIKRQRESCAAEPPFNAHVRRDYFGYYPTCWSKFPEGWACPCPNPELPDPAASYRKNPRGPLPDIPADDAAPAPDDADPGMRDTAPPTNEGAPPLPDRGRQPFNMNLPASGGRRTGPGAATPATPDPSVPPNGASLMPPASAGATNSVGLLQMPSLPAPGQATEPAVSSLEPGSMALTPEVTQASTASIAASRDLGPLPAAAPPSPSVGMMSSDAEPVVGPATPAQAPQRKGILGGLFGQGNRRRR